jgi:hypothetical protein
MLEREGAPEADGGESVTASQGFKLAGLGLALR